MWWMLLAACSGSPQSASHSHDGAQASLTHAVNESHEHAEPAAPSTGHAAAGDHMMQMAAVRDRLRAELGAAYDQPVEGLDTANADHGKVLYEQHCASCHGATGKGDGSAAAGLPAPPSDLTDRFHARFYSDAGRMRVIEAGAAESGMPAYGAVLSRADLLDVYAFVRSLRGGV
jgi:mono/diheme cytochrome c family protein